MSHVVRRSDLVATYAHPYRRWVPVVLRGYGTHQVAVLAVGAVILKVATGYGDGMLVLGVSALIVAAGHTLWAAANGARMVRERTEEWRRRADPDHRHPDASRRCAIWVLRAGSANINGRIEGSTSCRCAQGANSAMRDELARGPGCPRLGAACGRYTGVNPPRVSQSRC